MVIWRMRKIFLLSVVFIGLAMAQGSDPVVAEVGKAKITLSQFNLQWTLFVRQELDNQGIPFSPETEAGYQQYKPEFLARLAQDQAVINWAERKGLGAKPDEVEASLAETKASFPSEEEFAKALDDAGIPSLEAYKQLLYAALTYNAYIRSLLPNIKISEASLRSLYYLYRSELALPEKFCASHILLNTKEEAAKLLARLAKGEKFEALAKEFSQDPGSREEGGLLGCQPRGTYVPEFEAALRKLKPGEITKTPVQSKFGFHIIRLEKVEPAGYRSLDSVREGLTGQLTRLVLQKLVARYAEMEGVKLYPENLGGS